MSCGHLCEENHILLQSSFVGIARRGMEVAFHEVFKVFVLENHKGKAKEVLWVSALLLFPLSMSSIVKLCQCFWGLFLHGDIVFTCFNLL